MKLRIIKASQFKSNPWTGGTTSELFIYPETAQYKKSDFAFRLSTATIETSPSIFTPLAGINRSLLALKGTMTLSHKRHHTKKQDQFAIDYFDGGWETKSVGTCIAFNLMTRGSTRGDISGFSIEKGEITPYEIPKECTSFFVYSHSGNSVIQHNGTSYRLQTGDLLVLESFSLPRLEVSSIEKIELVFVEITH